MSTLGRFNRIENQNMATLFIMGQKKILMVMTVCEDRIKVYETTINDSEHVYKGQ